MFSLIIPISDQNVMFFNVFILFFYSIYLLRLWYKLNGANYYFIQLPVLVTIIFYLLQVVFPIIVFFSINTKEILDQYYEYYIAETNYQLHISRILDYTLMSLICFWFGVFYFFGSKYKFNYKILKFGDNNIHIYVLLILYFIGILSRLIQINLDIYGYNFDFESHLKYDNYKIVLVTIETLSTLAFFLITLYHRKKSKYIYFTIVFLELAFALISGFKFRVISIGLIIFLIDYLETSKLKLKYAFFLFGIVTLAYAIIEPIRLARKFGDSGGSAYFSSVTDAISTTGELASSKETEALFIITLMERFDIVSNTTRAVLHKDKVGLNKDDPEFLESLILAPVHALIPRVIWKGKPRFDYGIWFTKNVLFVDNQYMSENSTTSSAIGPIGYLYLCGGVPIIIIYCLITGLLCGFINRYFIENVTSKYLIIIYLTFISFFIYYDIHGLINHIFKTLPIMIIFFKFISGPSSTKLGSSTV